MWRRSTDIVMIALSLTFVTFMWQANRRLAALEASPRALAARPAQSTTPLTGEVENIGIQIGRSDAPITIVQFTDFECPFCAKFYKESMPALYDRYIANGDVRMVVRMLPMPFHPKAMDYARSARCVSNISDQSHEYQAALYAASGMEVDSAIAAATAAVGLKADQIAECAARSDHAAAIAADVSEADKLRLNGTPAFVIGPTAKMINGKIIVGAVPLEKFTSAIDSLKSHISD